MAYEQFSDDYVSAHFMPRIAVPDHERYMERGLMRAEEARGRLRGRFDIPYGDSPLQTLDVFPAGRPDAPIQVFIHGGYWRSLDKRDFAYVAAGLVPGGATVALINYDLCPQVTVDDIVRQCREAVAWIWRNGAALGGDPRRLHLSGNSVGAHLVAMMLAQDWQAEGMPRDAIKGVCCITGIFDIEPVLRIQANEEIRLKPEMVARNSPLHLPLAVRAPAIVAVGGDEPAEWVKQSAKYHAKLQGAGLPAEFMLVPDTNHFSVTEELANPAAPLTRTMLRQMGL